MKEKSFKQFIENLGKGIDPLSLILPDIVARFRKYARTYNYLLKAKKAQLALIDEVQKHINQVQEINIADFLVDDIDRFTSAWTGFLVACREWKDDVDLWKEQYYYPMVTYRGAENIILPENIIIYINDDARIRYSVKLFPPAVTQNTGNRIQCQSIYIASKVFGLWIR